MAAPLKFSESQVIEAVRSAHGMVYHAARRLRCEADTIYNYAKRYPSVAMAIRDERERLLDLAELALFEAIHRGEAWAIRFMLKTQGKHRGYVERREITGKGGAPCAVALTWHDSGGRPEGRAGNHGGRPRAVGDATRSSTA